MKPNNAHRRPRRLRIIRLLIPIATTGLIGTTLVALAGAPATATTEPKAAPAAAPIDPLVVPGGLDVGASRITRTGIAVRTPSVTSSGTLSAPGRSYTTRTTKPGSATYTNTARDTDTVVQQTAGGARILEVLRSANAPTVFTYTVSTGPGESLLPQDDGSILIGAKTVEGHVTTITSTAVIPPPWAVDAAGKTIPARYAVRGNTLRMTVDRVAGTT